jgi:hypothetical protein
MMSMKRILERLKPGRSDKPPEAPAATTAHMSGSVAESQSRGSAKSSQAPKNAQAPAKAKPPAPSDAVPKYQWIRPPIPEVITEEYLDNTFMGLERLLNDKEVQENTRDGLRLIEFILNDSTLFDKWIGDNRMLALFLKSFPDMHKRCVDNILRWQETWSGYLDGRVCLFGFLDNCPKQRRQILDFVFSHKEVYGGFFSRPQIGEFLDVMEQVDLKEKLTGEVSYRHKALMILANHVELYNRCVMGSDDFWKWQNDEKNAPYREALFMHHINNDEAYHNLFGYHVHLSAVLEKFPHKAEEIYNFIFSTPNRFEHSFPSLFAINNLTPDHETNEEQKQLRQRLFEHSLTIPGYEKEGIGIVKNLTSLCESAPDFGKYVMSKMLDDPEWLLHVARMRKDVKAICSVERYKPLKEAFIAYLYLHPDTFTTHITDERALKVYIEIMPEEEANLRHYYDLYTQKTTVPSKM